LENENDTSDSDKKNSQSEITLPRRVLYAQAALLAVSSVTFFFLGMMVGNLTGTGGSVANGTAATGEAYVADCRVRGQVVVGSRAEPGAVVVLLPKDKQPKAPLAPGLVMPGSFVALDNPTIDVIHQEGGAVVRTDDEGRFELLVDTNRRFRLWVLSRSRPSSGKQVTDAANEQLESWFAPTTKLIRENEFQIVEFETAGDAHEVGEIKF